MGAETVPETEFREQKDNLQLTPMPKAAPKCNCTEPVWRGPEWRAWHAQPLADAIRG